MLGTIFGNTAASNRTYTAPIFQFNQVRTDLVRKVVDRVLEATNDPLFALNDAAYWETHRLSASTGPAAQRELANFQRLARSLGKLDAREQRLELRELVEKYAWDIAGNFDSRVFQLSTKLLPPVIAGLLSPRKLGSLLKHPEALSDLASLESQVIVEGPSEKLRSLAQAGTLIFVPTHLSNMDSVVFGYALERSGLPPATYGAGKNLFTNPILSFFMHNLGAYKVDRRIKHNLYKEVLKTYSCVLLERGYHSLFFPGGTRCRSGAVERKLKLGLVGSAHEAYARSIMEGRERRLFFVPATINYLITLEAETLISDFLSEAGKGRFIIEDDESTELRRMAAFVRKLFEMRGAVLIRFSEPLDAFGNAVDEAGGSLDRQGRPVNPASYVQNQLGDVVIDRARDVQYARELGDEIIKAYARDTVLFSTHVVAAAAFEHLRKASPASDLFSVLRMRDTLTIPRDDLASTVVRIRDRLAELERAGKVRLADFVRQASGGDVVERAVQAFSGYHTSPVLAARSDGIRVCDTNLLYYYQNRLIAHGLAWDAMPPQGGAS